MSVKFVLFPLLNMPVLFSILASECVAKYKTRSPKCDEFLKDRAELQLAGHTS